MNCIKLFVLGFVSLIKETTMGRGTDMRNGLVTWDMQDIQSNGMKDITKVGHI